MAELRRCAGRPGRSWRQSGHFRPIEAATEASHDHHGRVPPAAQRPARLRSARQAGRVATLTTAAASSALSAALPALQRQPIPAETGLFDALATRRLEDMVVAMDKAVEISDPTLELSTPPPVPTKPRPCGAAAGDSIRSRMIDRNEDLLKADSARGRSRLYDVLVGAADRPAGRLGADRRRRRHCGSSSRSPVPCRAPSSSPTRLPTAISAPRQPSRATTKSAT